ncbi:hypothetical protein ACFX15_025493 [Malus domestica]
MEGVGPSSTRKCQIIDKDHISKLPDDVFNTIISLLSMRDGIQTSVLLPRWKNMYAYISNLEFDWCDPVDTTHEETVKRNVCDFLTKIDRFSACHLGTKVVSKVPASLKVSGLINSMTSFAIRRGRLLHDDSLRRLKALVVSLCEGVKGIELSATQLSSFYYKGDNIQLSSESVPNLEEVHVTMKEVNVIPTFARLRSLTIHQGSASGAVFLSISIYICISSLLEAFNPASDIPFGLEPSLHLIVVAEEALWASDYLAYLFVVV